MFVEGYWFANAGHILPFYFEKKEQPVFSESLYGRLLYVVATCTQGCFFVHHAP